MKLSSRWISTALFTVLMALFAYENAILLQAELRFTADCQRDLFLVYGLSHEGTFPHTGIRVAALGLDLGPLYHVILAPFIAIWPSPATVHWFNLLVCMLGLWTFWRWAKTELGPAPALMSILLYTQSTGHTALSDTVWHVGATPGVIFGLIATAGWWLRTGRTATLLITGALLSALIQLHSLGIVFGPAGLCALWLGRHHLTARRVGALVCVMLAVSLPLLAYLIPSLSDPIMGVAKHDGGFEFSPDEFTAALLALLQPRYLLDPVTTRATLVACISIGLLGIPLSSLRKVPSPLLWRQLTVILSVQILVGSAATASVISYELVGRYFLPIIIPLFVIAGLGIAHIDRWLRARGRSSTGRAVTFGATAIFLCVIGPAEVPVLNTVLDGGRTLRSGDSLDYLLLEEQEAIVDFFVNKRGLSWNQMRGRIHGNFFGPYAGIRYLERIQRDQNKKSVRLDQLQSHWRIRVDGRPAPPLQGVLETVEIPQRTRTLVLERYAPRINPETIRVARRPCSWSLPYIWSQSTAEQLKLVGFPLGHGPDIHHCMGQDNPVTIEFPISAESLGLVIELSVDGDIRPGDLSVVVHANGLPDLLLPLAPTGALSKSHFSVTIPSHDTERSVTIELNRARTLGFLDIY